MIPFLALRRQPLHRSVAPHLSSSLDSNTVLPHQPLRPFSALLPPIPVHTKARLACFHYSSGIKRGMQTLLCNAAPQANGMNSKSLFCPWPLCHAHCNPHFVPTQTHPHALRMLTATITTTQYRRSFSSNPSPNPSPNSITDHLESLNMPYRLTNTHATVQTCPFCHPTHGKPDNEHKLGISVSPGSTGLWNCLRCGNKGNWKHFVDRLSAKNSARTTINNPNATFRGLANTPVTGSGEG